MKRVFQSFLVLICLLSWSSCSVHAVVDPLSTPNNKYGIHITDQNDLEAAAQLVNSSGGDWGYVTLVIRADDRRLDKWQPIFDQLRQLHLIPLVRLSTVPQGDIWQKPDTADIPAWIDFLNHLNWVVKNRYVILYNEPNHATEWGGDLKPNEYVTLVQAFTAALRAASPDFFILPAGLDAAAANGQATMSLVQYAKFMHAADPNIFNLFDGWTSHAYPNPNFSGNLRDRSNQSLVSYRSELNLLSALGLKKNLPVFITETGWIHTEGQTPQMGTYSANKVADLLVKAYTTIWQDSNIVAITPFMLNYPVAPFDHFSWTKPDGAGFYPQYQAVLDLPKLAGQPVQIDGSRFASVNLPPLLVNMSVYEIPLTFLNVGQSIWTTGSFEMVVDGTLLGNHQLRLSIPETIPFASTTSTIHIQTPPENGQFTLNVRLEHQHKPMGDFAERLIQVISPPSLTLYTRIGYRTLARANDLTLLIYDHDRLVKTMSPVAVQAGVGSITDLRDIVPNHLYRFVLLKPYYLPRQTLATLSPANTTLTFKRLLPFDFNRDGQFSLGDVWAALLHPRTALALF